MSVQAEILGVVNITRDSFSDGGRFFDPARALVHCAELLGDGAHILDLGPASSNPDAEHVSADDEIARLAPVLDGLDKLGLYGRSGFQVSVDSFQTETQRYALSRGVEYLNDIQGFFDPTFYPELAASTAKLIVMHSVQRSGIATRDEVGVADMI
ncbi:MAG: dihydropteroate synthase, partial [Parvibaculaceae bacterium]|nr:dihydropteroate synthase [Parvibaculaceae bacterium]